MSPISSRFPRTSGRLAPALVAVLALALSSGCTGTTRPVARPPLEERVASTATPALRALYDQRVDWQRCPGDDGTDPDTAIVQCATLKVPLDYADPAGRTIDVALAKVPAADRENRLGALLLNPGGPGNSGVKMVRWGWQNYQGPLHDRYDLVGFDPRGTGDTVPLQCLDDSTRDEYDATDDPDYGRGRVLAEACEARHADLLPHLGTRDTARDLDVLRGALGERRLDFLGFSYGTHLGARYAEEFPDRTGRLVLDGAVEHGVPTARLGIEQAVAAEDGFRAFAADWATEDGDSHPFGSDPATAPRRLARFLDGLRAHPLHTADGRALTAALGWGAVLDALADGHQSWSGLRDVIEPAVTRGEGENLLALADSVYGRGEDGRYQSVADAFAAISCADGPPPPTDAELAPALAELAARAPLTTGHDPAGTLLVPDCRAWPYHSPETAQPVRAPGSAPVLVIGSTGDPVTPYAWAQRLAGGLEHGVLLTRDGDGHMAYYRSACVRDAVTAYLVDGRLPAASTHCATD
ncbi:alpha/beta hydrolase [Kitasatospora sp. NPDC002543]